MKKLVKAALAVAKHYPVFPTNDKMPCWSNKELAVKKGDGGYKIASQDPKRVEELFSHRRATEIAVPMGAMSGLLCVDVDLYKNPALEGWVVDNEKYLSTRYHTTRSGGLHFIFKHPGDNVRFPSTLREGVDLKAGGTGYICWPGTEGYNLVSEDVPINEFPMELLKEAMLAKGGTGSLTGGDSYNPATDDDLVKSIQEGTELYPALRSLAYRMPGRRQDNGMYLSEGEMVTILRNVMDTSVAADSGHARHDDWVDRRGKIKELVSTAIDKEKNDVSLTEVEIAAITKGDSFIKAQQMIAQGTRPIGPQRVSTPKDVEARIAEMRTAKKESTSPKGSEITSDFVKLNVEQLRSIVLPPIKWVIPQVIAEGGTVALAGMSNVGKTRWMAALVVAMSVGDTARMGLPQCVGKVSTLYIANEEHVEDMARRFKACALQHGDKKGADIIVRGKKTGSFRLVAINETGHPEVDEKNVAILVAEIRQSGCSMVVLDPYVTLAEGGDENSATTASMLTKAMLLVISMTGCSIFFPHHTPKDRARDNDAFRGSADAFRGSGAIYSSLDMGFTLCNYLPRNKEQRKAWKQQYLSDKLSRFIVLDCAKIREGEAITEIIMQLVPQNMDKGEGDPIGVVQMSSEADASNALLAGTIDTLANGELARAMINTIGEGEHKNMMALHRMMKGHKLWPDVSKTPGKDKLFDMFEEPYNIDAGSVHVMCSSKGMWRVIITETE